MIAIITVNSSQEADEEWVEEEPAALALTPMCSVSFSVHYIEP
jgi:hypothetical protein